MIRVIVGFLSRFFRNINNSTSAALTISTAIQKNAIAESIGKAKHSNSAGMTLIQVLWRYDKPVVKRQGTPLANITIPLSNISK